MINDMAYTPFFFSLGGLRIVLIGGGAVAMAKTEALGRAAAQLRVYAREVLPELKERLTREGGAWEESEYDPSQLESASFVIAATDDAALNARIAADARMRRIPVNVVDTPELCDFIFPAIVERGDIRIAVSTSGVSPVLARLIKRRIEQALPWNLSLLSEWLQAKRNMMRARFPQLQARRMFWERLLEGNIAQAVLEGNAARAESLFTQALQESPTANEAALWLIGAGPGHPDLITVRATQLLGQADVVLYDRLVATELLTRYARKDARKIPVGKQSGGHGRKQEEIGRLLEEHLREGKKVARLKGGDPAIFARAAEEIEVASRLGAPWEIVPGVTAALGCAAHAGIPLTERGGALGVRFITLYDDMLHDGAYWQSLRSHPQDTLVFYMSTHTSRIIAARLLEAGFPPEMPLLLIEQGTTPLHREHEATLGDFSRIFEGHSFQTPSLLIAGDVVRLRAQSGWREEAAQAGAFFEAAP